MQGIRVITIDEAVKPGFRHCVSGTSGIYALVDPETHIPRYVGSSQHIECRLYEHVRKFAAKDLYSNRRMKWLKDLVDWGLFPEAWVLEECEVGDRQSEARLDAERRWIEVCQNLFGGADLNGPLTPVGHVASKDSPGKLMRAEMRYMRKRISELESELAIHRGFGVQRATRAT